MGGVRAQDPALECDYVPPSRFCDPLTGTKHTGRGEETVSPTWELLTFPTCISAEVWDDIGATVQYRYIEMIRQTPSPEWRDVKLKKRTGKCIGTEFGNP